MKFFKHFSPALLLAAAVALPHAAWAHAVLVDSTPKANDTVRGPVLEIDLKFNSRVDAPRSTLQIVGPDGNAKTLELATQKTPGEINAHAKGLAPGAYTLRWQALAKDGHITRGQILFKVE